MITKCKQCNKKINKKPSQIKIYKDSFCGLICQGLYRRKRKNKQCAECNKNITVTKSRITKNNFCSRRCSVVFHNRGNKWNYKGGYSSYRQRTLKNSNKKCSNINCELTKAGIEIDEMMLDVDHINGKKNGHDKKNLRILCVWCHVKRHRTGTNI